MTIRTASFFAWLAFVAVAVHVTADDELVPADQSIGEVPVTEWVPRQIRKTGGVLGRTPALAFGLIGMQDATDCATNADGDCILRTCSYGGLEALRLMRQANDADLGSANLVERLFIKAAMDGCIGSGAMVTDSVLCEQECPPPNPQNTPQPCVDTYCDAYRWVLDGPEPTVEEPSRKVRLDEVNIVFGGSFGRGFASGVFGRAAKITDGEKCAEELRTIELGDGDEDLAQGCGFYEFSIGDKAKAKAIIENDGTQKRLRRRILEEAQAKGDLPAGTISGDAL